MCSSGGRTELQPRLVERLEDILVFESIILGLGLDRLKAARARCPQHRPKSPSCPDTHVIGPCSSSLCISGALTLLRSEWS